jgi:hypothetical protein
MSFQKYLIFILVLLLLNSNKTFSQSAVFQDGEELYYEVYYSFVNIGWLKFNTQKINNDRFLCTAVLRSNDALPFVTVNFTFTSEIEIRDNNIRPFKFESKEVKDGRTSTLTYDFNYNTRFVDIKKIGFDNNIEYQKQMPLNAVYQDGLSIFYYARYNFFANHSVDIPVLFNQDSASVHIDFNTSKTDIDVDAIDYDVSSVLLQGSTDYQLVFGLTGAFSGWFSFDGARIPVKARLKVKIGNVSVELKSWKRTNWSAPKY